MSVLGTVLFSLVGIIGTLGNIMIILVYTFKPRRRFRKLEILLKALAYGDLWNSFGNSLFFLYWRVVSVNKWHFGNVGCKLIPTLSNACIVFTYFVMFIMTIDRDRAIVTPLQPQFGLKTIRWFIATSLLVSVLTSINFMFIFELKNGKCDANYSSTSSVVHLVTQSGMNLVFTLTLAITSYRMLHEFLKTNNYNTTENFTPDQHKDRMLKSRIIRLVIAVDIIFVICTYPFDFLVIFRCLEIILQRPISWLRKVTDNFGITKLLYISNGSINIFVYCIINPMFRKDLLGLFAIFTQKFKT